jgi:hypothetical protein
MSAPLEMPQSDPFPDPNVLNVVRPEDEFGQAPRWVVPDQAPVSRFEAGDSR